MSERLTINANTRSEGKVRDIRKAGFVPALIYNHGKTDKIQVKSAELSKLFLKGVTESTLIDINLNGGESEVAFIKEYQIHPLSEDILHIDFFRITFGEKIHTSIPIKLIGKPSGVKEGGVLEIFLHEIAIETFPKYLTSSLDCDISMLKIGDSVHMDEIQIPPKSKFLMEGNPIICQISTSAKLESKVEDISSSDDNIEDESKEEGPSSDK